MGTRLTGRLSKGTCVGAVMQLAWRRWFTADRAMRALGGLSDEFSHSMDVFTEGSNLGVLDIIQWLCRSAFRGLLPLWDKCLSGSMCLFGFEGPV